MKRFGGATAELATAAPETAMAAALNLKRAAEFLHKKLPKSTVDVDLFRKEYMPSSIELAKFERYLAAVDSPLTVLDDLESGTITREQVEAIREVYPDLYERIRIQAMNEIEQGQGPKTYNDKIQLGILLNIPSDSSLLPKNIAALQSSFAPQNEQEQQTQQQESAGMIRPTSQALSKVDFSGRLESGANKVASKDE
jgi:hypothetical protein